MTKPQPRPTRPASLSGALKAGFSGAYDSIGFVIAVSLICFVLLTACALAAIRIVQMDDAFTVPVTVAAVVFSSLSNWMALTGAVFYATAKANHRSADSGDAVDAIRSYAGLALRLYCLDMLIFVVLLGDTYFFVRTALEHNSLLYAAVGIVFGYLALMWSMMMMYHLPLMAAYQRPASEIRVLAVWRDSFVLLGGSPRFTVGLFLVIIALACLCAVPMLVGTALIFPGTAAFLAVFGLRELFIRFGIVQDDAQEVEDKPWKLPDKR